MMNNNDFNQYDMAYALFEEDYNSREVDELLNIAREVIRDRWLDMAHDHPRAVERAYKVLLKRQEDTENAL